VLRLRPGSARLRLRTGGVRLLRSRLGKDELVSCPRTSWVVGIIRPTASTWTLIGAHTGDRFAFKQLEGNDIVVRRAPEQCRDLRPDLARP